MHKFKIQSHVITTILELVAIATSKANHQQSIAMLYIWMAKNPHSHAKLCMCAFLLLKGLHASYCS